MTILVLLLSLLFSPSEHGSPANPVLIVCDQRPQMEVLAKYLREHGDLSVEIVGQDDFPGTLSEYAAVFQYVHESLEQRVERALIKYVRNGGRLINLHHGISSSKLRNPEFLGLCGVTIFKDKPVDEGGWKVLHHTRSELVILSLHHYITTHQVRYDSLKRYVPSDFPSVVQELPVLIFEDTEVFLNLHFTDGREKTVLFGIEGRDPETGRVWMQDRGGWYQRKGNGWIFYFQVGHAISDFKKNAYCQILLNCVLWPGPGEWHN